MRDFSKSTFSLSIFIPKKHNRWNGSGMTELEVHNFYCRYLPSVIRSLRGIFRGCKIIIYHNEIIYNSFYGAVLNELNNAGYIKLIPVFSNNGVGVGEAMLWRMKAIWDADTRYVFMRDVDYIATPRERVMVEQFMDDETIVHAISDSAAHCLPMMGGTIGFDKVKFLEKLKCNNWKDFINYGVTLDTFQTDQVLINKRIWEDFKKNSTSHRTGWKPEVNSGNVYTQIEAPLFDDLSTEINEKGDSLTKLIGSCDCNIYEAVKMYDDKEISAIEESMNFFLKESDNAEDISRGIFFKRTGSILLTLPHNKTARKKVLFSITGNEDYSFFAPVTSCLWNEYIGFTPIVFVVGTFEEWCTIPRKKLVIDKIIEVGGEVHFIKRLNGILDSTVAQVSRVYPFIADYNDEQYVLTSDADMLPIGREWFNGVDGSGLHLFYANAYNYRKFPICYIGAKIKIWKKIMEGSEFDDELLFGLGYGKDGMEAWCYDEEMFGAKAHRYIADGGAYEYIVRDNENGLPKGRIDRSKWEFDKNKPGLLDCHSLRPAQDGSNWDRVLEVLSFLLPDRRNWFIEYKDKFLSL